MDAKHAKGVRLNGHAADETVCMVVGCARAALYRNKSKTRGYCRTHKSLALPPPMLGYSEDYAFKKLGAHL
jgi:hypothetical protein